MAFTLQNGKKFFISEPGKQIYDLFTLYRDVQGIRRINRRMNASISKIMLVILSREEKREGDGLEYELSDLVIPEDDSMGEDLLFKFDES